MSKKDVDVYYKEMCAQYSEMMSDLKDIEKEVSENICPPEQLERMKKILQPIKTNYERISYIMYLLNMPEKNHKKKKYEKQNKKILDRFSNNSTKNVKEENSKALTELKNVFT